MKKANNAVLAISLAFICILLGFFFGRISAKDHITAQSMVQNSHTMVTEQSYVTQPNVDGKININTASSHQLQMIPNIGEVLAERIVEYRNQNGPFAAIEDLQAVNGIGDKRLEELRKYITLGG